MGENFKLKWNDHHSVFFSTAEALCQGDHLTDVTLSCGKREFSAHKLVLSVCSTYFNELFTPRRIQKNHRPANDAAIVYLKDVDPHHMELLLNFMYRGEINVEEGELMNLLSTARGLQIRGLSDNDTEDERPLSSNPVESSASSFKNQHKPGPASISGQKAVKRSKTPPSGPSSVSSNNDSTSQPSTSSQVLSTPAKKIKIESTSSIAQAVTHHDIIPEEEVEEYDNPVEDQEGLEDTGEYSESGQIEGDYEEGEGMIYEGDLPPPEDLKIEGYSIEVLGSTADKLSDDGNTNNSCPFCGKYFRKRSLLRIHEMTHTGEKNFKCHLCTMAFVQKGNLLRHCLRVHKINLWNK